MSQPFQQCSIYLKSGHLEAPFVGGPEIRHVTALILCRCEPKRGLEVRTPFYFYEHEWGKPYYLLGRKVGDGLLGQYCQGLLALHQLHDLIGQLPGPFASARGDNEPEFCGVLSHQAIFANCAELARRLRLFSRPPDGD